MFVVVSAKVRETVTVPRESVPSEFSVPLDVPFTTRWLLVGPRPVTVSSLLRSTVVVPVGPPVSWAVKLIVPATLVLAFIEIVDESGRCRGPDAFRNCIWLVIVRPLFVDVHVFHFVTASNVHVTAGG